MTKKQPQFEPLELYSEEYEKVRLGVEGVLRQHFASFDNFDPSWEFHRFIGAYETLMQDFWLGEHAEKALDDLRRAISSIQEAYNSTPYLVRSELELNAEFHEWQASQSDHNEPEVAQSSGPIIPSELQVIAKSLGPLARRADDLIAVIEQTRRELPEGIPTRNRPLKEWALIHATVDVVRAFDAMNIPNSMDRAGPLYRLLRDIFEVFGIEKESFRRVYEGWREHIDGKYENADLLPI